MNEYATLFEEFSKLPKVVRRNPSLSELAGYPHYENVLSNILAFFFNSEEVHGFKTLFISSLINLVEPNQNTNYETISVEREVMTENGKRLDIVIRIDGKIIGIEHKIFASLYNDLDDYSGFLSSQLKENEKAIKIVLSLNKLSDTQERLRMRSSGFINISYSDFITEIKNRLGLYFQEGSPDYLVHIKDFIRTIENLINPINMNQAVVDFFIKYEERYWELDTAYQNALSSLTVNIPTLRNIVDVTNQKYPTTQGVWKKATLYHDIILPDKTDIVLEAVVRFKGWYINIFVRSPNQTTQTGQAKQFEIFQKLKIFSDKNISDYPKWDFKIVLEILPLETEIDEVGKKIMDFMSQIEYK